MTRVGRVRFVGSGTILWEANVAGELRAEDWGIEPEGWGATSFSELACDAREVERWNRLHPRDAAREGHVEACLGGDVPIVMVSDYVRAWPQLVAGFLQALLVVFGTDGFDRSDKRASLHSFFVVNRFQIVRGAQTQTREGAEVG